MKSYKDWLLFLFLGTLVSFGPFITDMYLVALPEMVKDFGVDISTIQMTLTFSMLGLAFGQIFFGYMGDKYGRKYPLITSLFLFTIFTFFSIVSNNINIFLFARFIQGFSGAGCIVLARSIIPDLFRKDVLIKAISITTLIYTINRIISPLIGGFAFQVKGWQGIFVCLLIIGTVLLISAFFIPETNTQRKKKEFILKKSLINLSKNKSFICFMMAFTFILTMQFAYIASCSFIFQKHYHINSLLFSFIFSFNAAIFGIGAFIPSKMKITEKVIKAACLVLMFSCLALVFIPLIQGNVYLYEFILVFFRLSTGFCFTVFMSKALDACRDEAGIGAALLGTFYFLFGSLVTPLVSYGNILYSSSIIMLLFSIFTCFVVKKHP